MNRKFLIKELVKILKSFGKVSRKQNKEAILHFGDKLKVTVLEEEIKSEIFRILKQCLKVKKSGERKYLVKVVLNILKFDCKHRIGRIY